MHFYIMPCLQQNLQKEIHLGATHFSRAKGFRVFSSLVSVQHFSEEEHIQTAVKVSKRFFLTVLPFYLCDRLTTGSKVLSYFITIDKSIGHV